MRRVVNNVVQMGLDNDLLTPQESPNENQELSQEDKEWEEYWKEVERMKGMKVGHQEVPKYEQIPMDFELTNN